MALDVERVAVEVGRQHVTALQAERLVVEIGYEYVPATSSPLEFFAACVVG